MLAPIRKTAVADENENTPSESKSESAASEQLTGSRAAHKSDELTGQSRPRIRRSIVALVIAAVTVVVLQLFVAPQTDHQIMNMLSALTGLVAVTYVMTQLHLECSGNGRRWIVPAVSVVAFACFAILFRFDGFSGAMVPQLTPRFFAKKHQLKTSTVRPSGQGAAIVPPTDESHALQDFPGFLGERRTGVIARRQFSVPISTDQIKILWDQGIEKGWSSFAVSGDRCVTLEQRDQQECVTCYRLADGELLWIHSHDSYHHNLMGGTGPRSTPTIEGNKVYSQGGTGILTCLDLKTGDLIWNLDLIKHAKWDQAESEAAITWGRSGSPLIVNGMCIVPFGAPVDPSNPDAGQRSLIALDAQNGKEVWRAGSDQISYASPVLMTLDGVQQIVSTNEKTISGHGLNDGKQFWSTEWLGHSNSSANCTSALPVDEKHIFIGKGYSGGSALIEVAKDDEGIFTAQEVWHSYSLMKTKFTHACIKDSIAFGISDGWLQAIDVYDERKLWMQPRRTRFDHGQMLLVEDIIVGQAQNGDVVFVPASDSQYDEALRWHALSAKTWNIPTIAGRHLLIRNDRQAICALLPERD